MANKIIDNIKDIEKPILKVMIEGFKLSFIICLLAMLILILYNTYPFSHITYQSGIILFRTGLMFAVGFFICGFAVDTIKNK